MKSKFLEIYKRLDFGSCSCGDSFYGSAVQQREVFFYNVEVPRVEFLSTVLWIDEGDDHGLKVRAYFYIKGEVV